jgi:hypothetical protein
MYEMMRDKFKECLKKELGITDALAENMFAALANRLSKLTAAAVALSEEIAAMKTNAQEDAGRQLFIARAAAKRITNMKGACQEARNAAFAIQEAADEQAGNIEDPSFWRRTYNGYANGTHAMKRQ